MADEVKEVSVRLSGALTFPDHDASATSSSVMRRTDPLNSENRFATALEDQYAEVDYTRESVEAISRAKAVLKSGPGDIQGFYDPDTGKSFLIAENLTEETAPSVLLHEVGVHMACDSALRARMKPFGLPTNGCLEQIFSGDQIEIAAEQLWKYRWMRLFRGNFPIGLPRVLRIFQLVRKTLHKSLDQQDSNNSQKELYKVDFPSD